LISYQLQSDLELAPLNVFHSGCYATITDFPWLPFNAYS